MRVIIEDAKHGTPVIFCKLSAAGATVIFLTVTIYQNCFTGFPLGLQSRKCGTMIKVVLNSIQQFTFKVSLNLKFNGGRVFGYHKM